MTPAHHLPPSWLRGAARGTLTEGARVVVQTHLVFCPTCRARLADAEEALASTLAAHPTPVDPAGLEAVMARLDAPAPPEPPDPPSDPILPWTVSNLTGPLTSLRWRRLAPGVEGVDLPVASRGLPLRLVRMRAGRSLHHVHQGDEAGVVLAGGWTDQFGTYVRGDASFFPADLDGPHRQEIHDDGDCIALVLNERTARLPRPLGWLSRWLVRG